MKNKKVYVHFNGNSYLNSKSDLLKVQMEVVYIKKMLRNLSITRSKKVQYKTMLRQTINEMSTRIQNLDSLMPIDKEIEKISLKKTIEKIPEKVKPVEKQEKPVDTYQDDLEKELLSIKQQLARLNQ